MVAEGRGPLLYHERVFSYRKEAHWGKRRLKRDE
jgi:hypothetical protein